MIPFTNQEEIVLRIATMVASERGQSCCLAIPPCFAEDDLSRLVRDQILAVHPRARIAVVSADRCHTREMYVELLSREWGVSRPSAGALVLEDFLGQLPAGEMFIQILRRFDKILDAMDEHVLGVLRDYEIATIRSVVFSPFDYSSLRERWRNGGRKLLTSSYGDAHAVFRALPLEAVDVERHEDFTSLQPHLAREVLRQSGAFPEAFHAGRMASLEAHASWQSTREAIADCVAERLAPVLRKLEDLDSSGQFIEVVARALWGQRDLDTIMMLRAHPWWRVLFHDDERPRAAALTSALVRHIVRSNNPSRATIAAIAAYDKCEFAQVMTAMSAHDRQQSTPAGELLQHHARIMQCLSAVKRDYSGDGLFPAIQASRVALQALRPPAPDEEALEIRYRRLEEAAVALTKARQRGTPRIIDALAGSDGREAIHPLLAVTILHSRMLEACEEDSPTESTTLAANLPEQMFRIWAAWHPGLLHTPDRFPSFPAFAHEALRRAIEMRIAILPEPDPAALDRALVAYEPRRHAAHALAGVSARARDSFMALTKRWFLPLLAPCTAHPISFTEAELLEFFESLPRPDSSGALKWPLASSPET